MANDALNFPPGCTSDDVDNAWGTQCPIDERDPDAEYDRWRDRELNEENENESDVQS